MSLYCPMLKRNIVYLVCEDCEFKDRGKCTYEEYSSVDEMLDYED